MVDLHSSREAGSAQGPPSATERRECKSRVTLLLRDADSGQIDHMAAEPTHGPHHPCSSSSWLGARGPFLTIANVQLDGGSTIYFLARSLLGSPVPLPVHCDLVVFGVVRNNQDCYGGTQRGDRWGRCLSGNNGNNGNNGDNGAKDYRARTGAPKRSLIAQVSNCRKGLCT